jgi:hypothetical protein
MGDLRNSGKAGVASARMVTRMEVTLVDDLNGAEGAETVAFGLDGKEYEIDLIDKHYERLRKALKPFIDNGRLVRKDRPRSVASSLRKRTDDLQRIRKWAAKNGYDVPARGRIPIEVHEKFNAANPAHHVPLPASRSAN